MRLCENKVKYKGMHELLMTSNPWGAVEDGKFIGRLVLDECVAEDENNVSVYHFDVRSLINDFIEWDITTRQGFLCGESEVAAKIIIADMESMIYKLKALLPI